MDDDLEPTPGRITPYARLDDVLADHAAALEAALGEDFVGLYPVGSLAIGHFDLTSDVDFAVITRRDLDDAQVRLVQDAHTALLGRDTRWVRHLEYSFFPLGVLRVLSSPYTRGGVRVDDPARQIWYFGNGSPTIERSDHDNTLVTRWTLRYASRAVIGPVPASFAPEIGSTALRAEIRDSLVGWDRLVHEPGTPLRNRFHQVFLVLNNCRALQDFHEGRITSKLEGVRWALTHLDRRGHDLIEFSWREREDTAIHVSQPANADAFTRTLEFMSYGAAIAEAYGPPPDGSGLGGPGLRSA